MERYVSKRAIILGTLIFLAAAGGGCVHRSVVVPPVESDRASLGWSGAQPQSVSPDEETSPEGIRAAVEERFRLHRYLGAVPVHVVVEGTTVVLLGVVPGDLERSLAGRFALDIRGVSRIDNQLSIIEPVTVAARPASERPDVDLERDAVRSLMLSRRLGDESIRVVVRRGVARLIGIVESDGDRIYAGEIVAGVPGIREVKNGLVVQPSSPRLAA